MLAVPYLDSSARISAIFECETLSASMSNAIRRLTAWVADLSLSIDMSPRCLAWAHTLFRHGEGKAKAPRGTAGLRCRRPRQRVDLEALAGREVLRRGGADVLGGECG